MKTSSEFDTEVDRNGVTDDGEFGIVFNAKMAKILSDGLYSDKIGSIIRELCCNAIDSHVEAGCGDRAIEVHLPNQLEPWFHVRDFGVGLDHEQVKNVYTKYGASTKTTSNEFIGQLGLGSKSPFAYVDAFDVTAIKNGRRGYYSMYRNEKGMPSVALLGEDQTDEPSGVTVKMPVRLADMREFTQKAQKVFQWFDVQPQVTGVRDFAIPTQRVFWQGDNWRLLDVEYRYDSRKSSMAVMGRVAYPIAVGSLGKLTPAARAFLDCQAVLNFNIGDLEIAASREALGYDARTQAAIIQAVEQAVSQLTASIECKLAGETTLWSAKQTWNTLLGQAGTYSREIREILGTRGVKWRNQVISNGHVEINTKALYANGSDVYRSTPRHSRLKGIWGENCDIACNDRTTIIIDDLPRGGVGRANAFNKAGHGSDVWYFGQRNLEITTQELLEVLGNPPVIYTSNLPKPQVPTRTRAKMFQFVNGNWQEVLVDENSGGVFVLLERNRVVRGDETHEDFSATVREAIRLGAWDSNTKIYAPRNDWRKKIPALPQWKNFWTVLENNISAKFTPIMLQNLTDQDELATRKHCLRDRAWWGQDWSMLPASSVWAKFCLRTGELEARMKTQGQKYHDLVVFARELGVSIPGHKTVDVDTEWAEITTRYPMITYVINQGWRTVPTQEYNQVLTYVGLVDRLGDDNENTLYAWDAFSG